MVNSCILYQKVVHPAMHPDYINYHLKSEVSIMVRCQLSSTYYTAVQMKTVQ